MLINSFLRRFIVVRNGYQYGIHSRKIIVLQRVDYGLRAVTADSQQDGNSSVDTFDNRFLDFFLFFGSQGRCFGCRSQYAQKVCPVLYLVFDQSHQRLIIYASVFIEGSDQCDSHSS